MRTVIQLGLYTTALWTYLTRDDWVDYMRNELDQPQDILPEFFTEDPTPFQFYGVDVEPESIAHVANSDRYKDFSNIMWICTGISDDYYLMQPTSRYNGAKWYQFSTANKMHVYITMKHLIDSISPETFDVLAIDIDGYEHYIFDDMENWSILPTYITMEYHPSGFDGENRKVAERKETYDNLIVTIVGNGYTYLEPVIKYEAGNAVEEMQFLKTDFV